MQRGNQDNCRVHEQAWDEINGPQMKICRVPSNLVIKVFQQNKKGINLQPRSQDPAGNESESENTNHFCPALFFLLHRLWLGLNVLILRNLLLLLIWPILS